MRQSDREIEYHLSCRMSPCIVRRFRMQMTSRVLKMALNSDYPKLLVEKILQLENESEKMTLVASKDHQRVDIHRVILAAVSNYFQRYLGQNPDDVEIVLDGVDGKFIRAIVRFSQTGCIEITEENVKELLDFAANYEFKILHSQCDDFCRRQLTVDNCIKWFAFAGANKVEELRKATLEMICSHFENLPSSQMCELILADFKEIIDTDENMAREEVILDQMIKWIQFDELGRSEHASELLQCIRLKHITEKVLIDKVMVFCQKYNIVGFTDNECKERLHHPKALYQSRFAHARGVFNIHENGSGLIIRKFDYNLNGWRKVITITNDLPIKYYGTVFSRGKLFIMGGRITENGHYLKDVDKFDFASKTCADLPKMKDARDHFDPIVVDHYIYVFGGFNGISLKNCERFNMITEKWETLKPMQYGHHSLTVAAVNGKIYVADGINQNKGSCSSVDCYDPAENMWSKIASVLDPRLDPSFEGVLTEWKGRLYAVGVNDGLKRYDSERDVWEEFLDVSRSTLFLREDEILSAFQKLQLKNFNYGREQLVVKAKDFFDRLCTSDSKEVSLAEFSRNFVLNDKKSL